LTRLSSRWLGLVLASYPGLGAFAQQTPPPQTYTWSQLRDKFEATNPTLRAAELSVFESRAAEITAHLRPNPEFSFLTDGTQLTPQSGIWRPFTGTVFQPGLSYLIERGNKRNLRFESAEASTQVANSTYLDQKRTLLFNLRNSFIQVLQARAVLGVTVENLAYYDRVLAVGKDRLGAGDIAQVDLDRLELQRVQYESDVQSAQVNLRNAKIQLLMLLNARTPVEQFDVTGTFEFGEQLVSLEELRQAALDTRPDLKAAMQSVEQARLSHQLAVANGSTDPTVGAWYSRNPSFNNPFDQNTIGASISIPLRIHDRNQGEKERTAIDIQRNQRLEEAAAAQVFSDVDSAYTTLNSNLTLLRPYKAKYLEQALKVRETISFAYQHGGASLLDFLNAQNDYRSIQLNYLNLVGAYMTAANQLNLAVGREVVPGG
jgi:cobalt-zinc-cadmium efflux system outer membrane protein